MKNEASNNISFGNCAICNNSFQIGDNVGLGWSWNLYKCSQCGQLHAKATPGGFIPEVVLNDKSIVILKGDNNQPQKLSFWPKTN